MSYIEREALLKSLESKRLIFEESTPVDEAIAEQVSVFVEAIEEAPTADVVEVVRCKECIKKDTPKCAMWYDCGKCKGQWSWCNPNDFCSYGERSERQTSGTCLGWLMKDALALITSQEQKIKELTEDNEAQAETIKSLIETIKDVKADTVREIFKEIYSSLDYIEEQMEPEEIPECFFSVREDINALKVRFEGEGRVE